MSNNNKQSKPGNIPVELDGILAEFRDALNDEICEIKKNGQSSILLKDGIRLAKGDCYWYKFNIDYLPNIPADTPCKLSIGKETYEATVISYDESNIVVDVKNELPKTIAEAKLENGAAVLMELLIRRIETNSTKENAAGQRMLNASKVVSDVVDNNSIDDVETNATDNQKNAICHAVQHNITYIWGPPGTGKTKVISQIINELLNRNRTVLLVSHTNSAVDGAIKKVDNKYYSEHQVPETELYPILRLGAGAKNLEKRMQLENQVSIVGRDLNLQKEKLENEKKHITDKINEYNETLAKINWINSTHIQEIGNLFWKIQKNNEEIKSKTSVLESINARIENEKSLHPEYDEAVKLKHDIEGLNNKIKDLLGKKDTFMLKMEDIETKLSNVKDQIATHKQYSSLKESESHYFSEKTLNDKIVQCKKDIEVYDNNIKKYRDIVISCKKIIFDYDKKGFFGRLISGKKDYEQALSNLSKHSNLITVETNKKDASLKTLYSFNKQQVELLSIKQQLQNLKPEKTIEYWQKMSDNLLLEKTKIENTLKSINDSITLFNNELNGTKSKYDSKGDICKEIDGLVDERYAIERVIKDVKSKNDKDIDDFNILVDLEYDMVHGFYNIGVIHCQEDIKDIKDELIKIKNQVENIDSDNIKKDVGILRKRQDELSHEIMAICEKLSRIKLQIIQNAKVIGATLAKSYLSDEIQSRKFDTVILDEASMAAIPALWCAAQTAEKNIVIVGDFLQLSPIVLSKSDMAKKWLGRDIFSVSGVQTIFKKRNLPPDCCCFMLDTQFRMDKEIADIINMYYKSYAKLKSDDNDETRVKNRNDFNEWYNNGFERSLYSSKYKNKCVHMIDTESLNAWVTSVPSGKTGSSRLNAFSAVLTVELAFKLVEKRLVNLAEPANEPYVLIVAPYKPHVKRIEQLLQDMYYSMGYERDMNLIKAGTIHSFQGKEADVVIFDLVVDEPHFKANIFMPDKEINYELEKMFNVAISRARYKLFFVGNFNFCIKKGKNKAIGNLLNKLLVDCKYPAIDAKTYFPNMTFSKPSHIGLCDLKYNVEVCLENAFIEKLESDLQRAKKRIVIYSPFMTEKALASLLPVLKDAVGRCKHVVVITKTTEEITESNMNTQKVKCESILSSNGIKVIHKKGMHEKLIFIDDDIVWIGSLNLLSFSGTTREIMLKLVSNTGAKEFADLIDLDSIIEVSENTDEQKCPCCGKELVMAESNENGFYWSCIDKENCNWSRKPDEQYPSNGMYICQKCGEAYSLTMINEPRWVCNNDSRHYRKVRKADLKLNEMWKEIPQCEIDKVHKYFDNISVKENSKSSRSVKPKKQSNNSGLKSIHKKSVVQLDLFGDI